MKKIGVTALSLLILLNLSNSLAIAKLTPSSQPIPPTYFGMHIHNLVAPSRTGIFTPWPNVPISTWRLWDSQVRWPDIEPSKGQWRFDLLDKYLTLAEQHHVQVVLPLAVTPQWASSQPNVKSGWQQPGLTAEPKDMEDWRAFVRQVATHCKGRIYAYEIWNEPNLKQYWIGTPEKLVELTREAHDIVKRIDPQAIIVSPAATTGSGVSWLNEFLSKGGSRYVDVVGYHFYVFPQPPEAMVGLIQRVKQTMESNGAGDKPLWGTETGWVEPKPFPSEELGAAYLARAYVLAWAAGASRVYWYAWDQHSGVSLETVTEDNQTLKAAGTAFGTIQQWLSGAQMDWCDHGGDDTWSCQLERNGSQQWVVWSPKGPAKFKIPGSWHAIGATRLTGQVRSVSGATVDIAEVPMLITSTR